MITRIEIDGFKSFSDFSLDLPPFLAVIGTNASGKSNLVEALTFFALAATEGLDDAVAAVRGDARGLFRQRGDGSRCEKIRFAAEFVFQPSPPWRDALPSRWRYEMELSWGTPPGRLEGLVAGAQRLIALDPRADTWPVRFGAAEKWQEAYLSYEARPRVIEGRAAPAARESSALSLLLSYRGEDPADDEIVGRVETELLYIRTLHLEAGALRASSEMGGPEFMDVHGRHLPNFLRWLSLGTGDENRPLGVVADIETHLVGLVREVSGFEIVEDERRRDVRLEFSSPYTGPVGAEFASDGTLRMLAILAALHDPRAALVAVEEPENGVFPERLRHLLALVQELVSDIRADPNDELRPGAFQLASLRQALVTSHSPVILDVVERDRIVFLDTTTLLEGGVASHVTRVRWIREPGGPVTGSGERWARITDSELRRFRAGVEEPV
ncbi:AAA family ATPase [Actinoallomurus soli]|uniref:AAA family ATPase n=1 Tax=Actinoallomurus soli TaxID=2952535 RepID=UPI0020923469|nr:ATP-binding protein [Actinoallomurus soli]MCO5970910.1 AAA family ATPase [Actinoallomurus soli]